MHREHLGGLVLCDRFYQEVVQPLLHRHFPTLCYSAALIGPGSEVLGYDTPQSTDHDWGPRLLLFLEPGDLAEQGNAVDALLQRELPETFCGHPTRFRYWYTRRPTEGKTAGGAIEAEPPHHGTRLLAIAGFLRETLGFDATQTMRAVDWLSVPQHLLVTITAGRVFHDGLGQLQPIRETLSYYPRDVWMYLLAAQWRRIAQEEAFMGRCGQVGDELGSALLASRQVSDLMRLCFLMERRYAPYIKWLGTAFAELACAEHLVPVFRRVLAAGSWEERQKHLVSAYEFVADMHNALAITPPLSAKVAPYFDRPFLVINADRFSDAIREAIASEEVRVFPEHLGAVDQFVDSTDAWRYLDRLKEVYR